MGSSEATDKITPLMSREHDAGEETLHWRGVEVNRWVHQVLPYIQKRRAGASMRFAKSWSLGPATLPRMGTSERPGYICPCQFPSWTLFRAHFQGKCCAFKEVTLWANYAFTRMDKAQWGLLSLMEAELRCQWLSKEINSLTSPQAYNGKLFFQYLLIGNAETMEKGVGR